MISAMKSMGNGNHADTFIFNFSVHLFVITNLVENINGLIRTPTVDRIQKLLITLIPNILNDIP